MKPLQITCLEPYYAGSHAAFIDALIRFSRHEFRLATLPARKWKWRMRGASLWFTKEHPELWNSPADVDVIFVCDMLSVADLRATLPASLRNVPIVCYFHENQLTYPIPDENDRDYQYGMTNITSCVASDAVWFNSSFHLTEFLEAANSLLRKMPDQVPAELVEGIRRKSSVFYPPVPLASDAGKLRRKSAAPERETIFLWCHRWEYDKNPAAFFNALRQLVKDNTPFKLVITGEQFRTAPKEFRNLEGELSGHVLHAGYVESHEDYLRILAECDVVVSTAIQENFGIAVIEAISAGCRPLLPARLAYPEIIPSELHSNVLYPDDARLLARLRDLANRKHNLTSEQARGLEQSMRTRFAPENTVEKIDRGFEAIVQKRSRDGSVR